MPCIVIHAARSDVTRVLLRPFHEHRLTWTPSKMQQPNREAPRRGLLGQVEIQFASSVPYTLRGFTAGGHAAGARQRARAAPRVKNSRPL